MLVPVKTMMVFLGKTMVKHYKNTIKHGFPRVKHY